jgi:hypothetical protein
MTGAIKVKTTKNGGSDFWSEFGAMVKVQQIRLMGPMIAGTIVTRYMMKVMMNFWVA